MKHGAPWIIKSLFTAEDRDRVGPGAVAVRVETRRCNIASCLVKTIAAKVDSKLLRHTRISFPRTDISWAVVARYARSRPGRSPRSWRCIIVVRDRLSAELAAQTVAFIAMLIARVLNFGWKKKKYLREHARCISPVKSAGMQVASVNSRFISSSSA